MRIAIDTNALVAALTKPRGSAAKVVAAWREGRVELVSSEATLREAGLVLDARWLARLAPRGEIERLLRDLREGSVAVQPAAIDDLPLKDEGDLRLVEAAVAGVAAYLVTADRELLAQRAYGPTEFVTSSEMARLLPP